MIPRRCCSFPPSSVSDSNKKAIAVRRWQMLQSRPTNNHKHSSDRSPSYSKPLQSSDPLSLPSQTYVLSPFPSSSPLSPSACSFILIHPLPKSTSCHSFHFSLPQPLPNLLPNLFPNLFPNFFPNLFPNLFPNPSRLLTTVSCNRRPGWRCR